MLKKYHSSWFMTTIWTGLTSIRSLACDVSVISTQHQSAAALHCCRTKDLFYVLEAEFYIAATRVATKDDIFGNKVQQPNDKDF